jgi:hypothetical protein
MIATLLIAGVLAGAGPGSGRPGDDPKAFAVEKTNEQSGFMIRVTVDKPDRTYYEGEGMTVSIIPERDCYVYLLYYDAEGNIACLLPNEYQQQNFLKAKAEYQVPAPNDSFRFRARAPFGDELLQVVATLKPIDLFDGKRFTASGHATTLTFREIQKAMEVVQKEQDADVWAEARVPITTRPGGTQTQTQGPRPGPDQRQNSPSPHPDGKVGKRLAVCIGISQFKDPRVPQLRVCHQDAERVARMLQQKCGVDRVVLLTNEQATLAAMRKAIFEDLVRDSKPGDTVFIYFSGHGGRCADTNGDEPDGLDEYLVPYDGELGKPETMLIDDMFARWMQDLDGRQVCIVLDNCYSGGSSKAIKGLGGPAQRFARTATVDFFDGELRRAKDLGQQGTEVLAASQADQIAWEMPTGEGSVMTFFVLQTVDDPKADTNRDGRLSLSEIYNAVKGQVESYVQKTFNADQNPVMIDNANDAILLRP